MKVLRLRVPAFGHFTDVELDLSGGERGVHLVRGDNEAGKSTLLRAFTALFFGFEHRTSDAYQHANSALCVGARVRGESGEEWEFYRKKRQKDSYLDESFEPGDASRLERELGGLSRELFLSLFALHHDELARGSERVFSEDGALGKVLFAAGLGRAGSRPVLEQLDKMANELYKDRGKNQKFHVARREFREAKKAVQTATLSAREWQDAVEAHEVAATAANAARERLAGLRRDEQRAARELRARDLIPRYDRARATLADLGGAPDLPTEFGTRRESARREASHAKLDRDRLRKDIAALDTQLGAVELAPALVDQVDRIERFKLDLGTYRKEGLDRPALERERDSLRGEAAALLRDSRASLSLDTLSAARPSLDAVESAREVAVERERLDEEMTRLRREIEAGEAKVDSLEAARPDDVDARGLESLDAAIRATPRTIEAEAGELASEVTAAERSLDARVQALAGFDGDLDALCRLPLPSVATVDAFEAELSTIAAKMLESEGRRKDAQRRVDAAIDRRSALVAERAVPTEDEVAEARADRDRGLSRLHDAFDRNERESVAESFDEVERSIARADSLVDRMLAESDRVGELAGLDATRREGELFIRREATALEDLERSRADVEASWREAWPSGVEVRGPREMLAWLGEVASLRDRAEAVASMRATRDARLAQIKAHFGELGRALEVVGRALEGVERGARGEATLAERLTFAEGVVREGRRLEQLAKESAVEVRAVNEELVARRVRRNELRAQYEATEARWADAMSLVGFASSDGDAAGLAKTLGRLASVVGKLSESERLDRRIADMSRNREVFERAVTEFAASDALAGESDRDVRSTSAEETVLDLGERVASAVAAAAEHRRLSGERERLEGELRDATRRVDVAVVELAELARCAGCAVEELEEVEVRATEAKRWKTELGTLEERLGAEAGGESIDAFVERLRGTDPDAARATATTLARDVERAEAEWERLQQEVGESRAKLQALESESRGAAEAEQVAASRLARVEAISERYAVVRGAWKILSLYMDEYQARNRGPVLRRAGELFARLTLGAYAGLDVDYEGAGRPVITGRRGGGGRVPVGGMSDGTRDQLYLCASSLRAGASPGRPSSVAGDSRRPPDPVRRSPSSEPRSRCSASFPAELRSFSSRTTITSSSSPTKFSRTAVLFVPEFESVANRRRRPRPRSGEPSAPCSARESL